MNAYIGIDTSNYTTSVAAMFEDKTLVSIKIPLNVKSGDKGIRQSNALFMHTLNLPNASKILVEKLNGAVIKAIGVSTRPRNIQGSYMPCFLAGVNSARVSANLMNVPLYEFSHQEGHIMAASCEDSFDIDEYNEFIAFHISGGTNDMLHVKWNGIFEIEQIGASHDITSGQLVDRCGVMLGLDFPCGKELEKLALKADKSIKSKVSVKDCFCNISGAQNKCIELLKAGETHENIAKFTLDFVYNTIDAMLVQSGKSDKLPILFVGGVMSNSIIREKLAKKYNCFFAKTEYSSDNACGIAALTYRRYNV